ncbi:hypothetical protein [Pseudomonas citronellolis]|uniref:hypothetical protein n=1 Tax=Pseudomonas citronellolis TaxID=53408 RepID=UPI00078E1B0A|nr:hypothetical protein [Pseudomonas citronellolis]AMO78186.1 hypothetical protein PcP3B5_47990 [Pseudomonas citronellolis]WRT80324.1 hypothetical protein VK748_17835 [Pseudomonas citronellolis]
MKIVKLSSSFTGRMDKSTSAIIWIAIAALLILIAFTKKSIFPERFFFDEEAIWSFMQYAPRFNIGEAYSSTAAFYKLLGASPQSNTFIALSCLGIIFTIYRSTQYEKITSIDFVTLMLIIYFGILSMTYMTLLSKDLIVFLILYSFIPLARNGMRGLVLWTLVAALYAAYFRLYWILFLLEFWGVFFLLRFRNHPILLLLYIPLSLLALSIAFKVLLGVELDSFRTSINDVREADNARTMILPWVSGSGIFSGWINSSITWATLIVPIPLAVLITPYYLSITLFILMFYYKLWKKALNKLDFKNNLSGSSSALLIISFTAIQSIFEPDYGSYLRHLTPFFPVFLYAILTPSLQNKQKSSACIKT